MTLREEKPEEQSRALKLAGARLKDSEVNVHVRPHPGPLPQERGKYSNRFGKIGARRSRRSIQAVRRFERRQSTILDFTGMAKCFSLSLGERAGVRASVGQFLRLSL